MSSKYWLVAVALGFACASASAQPAERDHRDKDHDKDRDHDRDHRGGPNMPPPPPQAENPGARAGFEWVGGRWDWQNGKYAWMPGHWERERAGKHWHPGRWDNKGGTYVWVEGEWGAGDAPPTATVVVEPSAPPPPPQAENPGAKAGFEWVTGRWDWKGGKWEWMPGHWERERAGQHWHPGNWNNQNGHWVYVEGTWGAGEAAMPPMPPGPPGPPMPPPGEHHEWKLDKPVVSSYWPTHGAPGKHVTVRGHNFPPDTRVMWGNQPVPGAKIEPDMVRFDVPPGAPSATILLEIGHGRNLIVGNFDTAAGGPDPDVEMKRRDDELRKEAEARWAQQQKQMAHDRAAREAEWKKKWEEEDQTREQRREAREAEIRAKWDAAFLGDQDTQEELTLHAQRVADLQRALEVAQLNDNGKLVVRIQVAQGRENDRHDSRMTALKTAFAARGGAR